MRNSSLVNHCSADNSTGLKQTAEAADFNFVEVVGERSIWIEARPIRTCGPIRSDDAGMSNEKTGESPVRRKPKVSGARVILLGSAGP